MEIEPHPKDLTNGSKTSLRLRVVTLNVINGKRFDLLARELFDGQSQNGTTEAEYDPNGFDDEEDLLRVTIEGFWCQSRIVENSLIHLVQPRYDRKTNSYIVDNTSGLMVLEPDNLLTCTAVASTLWCERKTWLNHVFLGQVGGNRAMLVGTLVHEAFQHGLKHKITDIDTLTKFLDEQLDDATVMSEIYAVELHLNDIRGEAISYLSSVKEWIEKFMLQGASQPLTNDSNLQVKVKEVKDIEENVWSTKYGLKGKVDVTGLVRVHDTRTKTVKDKILPLELKTGNPKLSPSHEAQVSLYSMMLEDRYAEYNQGLVIYLKNQAAMHNVALNHNIKRDLIQRRNELNYHMKSFFSGPEMLNSLRVCGQCERQTECILMSNIYEHDLDRYNYMKEIERDATGHLDDEFIRFFQKYHEKLVTLMTQAESSERQCGSGGDVRTRSSFWTYTSAEAEARCTGFGKLQAEVLKGDEGLIRFTRHPDHKDNILADSANGSAESQSSSSPPARNKKRKIEDFFARTKKVSPKKQLRPFDFDNFSQSRCRLAVSRDDESASMDSQNSSTALAIGFMRDFNQESFVIKVFEGALDFIKPDCMFRVDRIEKKVNLDIERLVLVRLLAKEDWRCDRVRQLILDPKFVPCENIDLNLFVCPENFEELNELDEDTQKHVIDAVCTDTYHIVDEHMISNRINIDKMVSVLVRVICSLSRKVLIVAQNIDHLTDLMRLLQRKTRFILIDDGKSTQARFQYASNIVKVPQDDNMTLARKFDSYTRQLEQAPVVVTTYAMSIGGLLFARRTFDYCILYDCAKTELLVALAPMFCSDRHIMIDVIGACQSEQRLKEGDVSLSQHLRELRPREPKVIEID